MNVVLAEAANTAEWVAAIGQVLGAAFTAVAVAVALWIARRDHRARENDGLDRARAQARLIFIGEPKIAPEKDIYGNGEEGNIFTVSVQNLSDRAIIDIRLDVWPSHGDDSKRRIVWLEPDQILPRFHDDLNVLLHTNMAATLQANTYTMRVNVGDIERIQGWRVTWVDPDGWPWQVGGRAKALNPRVLRDYGEVHDEIQASEPA